MSSIGVIVGAGTGGSGMTAGVAVGATGISFLGFINNAHAANAKWGKGS